MIRNIHKAAFPIEERDVISDFVFNLLLEITTPPTLSFVAEIDNIIVGHIIFSPVFIDEDKKLRGYILSPLGVIPDHQKGGVGTNLVEFGIEYLTKRGVDIVLVYGDPNYYGRFGFNAEVAEHYIPPYQLEFPFGWQGIQISECCKTDSPTTISCVSALCNPDLW